MYKGQSNDYYERKQESNWDIGNFTQGTGGRGRHIFTGLIKKKFVHKSRRPVYEGKVIYPSD